MEGRRRNNKKKKKKRERVVDLFLERGVEEFVPRNNSATHGVASSRTVTRDQISRSLPSSLYAPMMDETNRSTIPWW